MATAKSGVPVNQKHSPRTKFASHEVGGGNVSMLSASLINVEVGMVEELCFRKKERKKKKKKKE